MTNVMGAMLLKIIGSQIGMAVILTVVARLLPKSRLRGMTRPLGRTLSKSGQLHFGRKVYEQGETLFLDTCGELWGGFVEGLKEEDEAEAPRVDAGKEEKPT